MIKKLPEEAIRRIASGQIASSPSAVLKELLENALDAGAGNISVKIENPFNFKVVDDGEGIPFKELPLAVERFATSKVSRAEELDRIESYGFRGEALYAVAQVSRLTIKSRFKNEGVGGKLLVYGGRILEHTPIPFSRGTSVEVANLYFNVPVRRKGVKRELSRMVSTVKTYTLCRPDVIFRIGEEVFPATSLEERVRQLFPNLHLTKVEGKNFLLLYNREITRKKVQQIFVNGRPVSLPEVERILSDKGVKNFILFLNLPPEAVDPNIVPSKEKVFIKEDSYLKELEKVLSYEFGLPSFHTLRERTEIEYLPQLYVIGSDGTLLIAHDRENYYFFDIHLLHERVNYEELLKKLEKGEIKIRKVLPPLELPSSLVPKLKKLSVEFYLERNSAVITGIPEILNPSDLEKLSDSVPESIAEEACKRAVKSGYSVVGQEAEKLLSLYLKCREREVCPHGRPIYYKVKKNSIYSKLGRRVK